MGWRFQVQPNGLLRAHRRRSSGGDELLSTRALIVGQWAHVAVTYDGEMLRIYFDGVLDAEVGSSVMVEDSAAPVRIGGNTSVTSFGGVLDEVAIYHACPRGCRNPVSLQQSRRNSEKSE